MDETQGGNEGRTGGQDETQGGMKGAMDEKEGGNEGGASGQWMKHNGGMKGARGSNR